MTNSVAKNKESNNLNFLSVTVKDRKFISKSFRKRNIKNVRIEKKLWKRREGWGFYSLEAKEVIRESASRDSFIMTPLMNFKIAREDRLWLFLHIAQ